MEMPTGLARLSGKARNRHVIQALTDSVSPHLTPHTILDICEHHFHGLFYRQGSPRPRGPHNSMSEGRDLNPHFPFPIRGV